MNLRTREVAHSFGERNPRMAFCAHDAETLRLPELHAAFHDHWLRAAGGAEHAGSQTRFRAPA